jgi:uncharacterized BrkB/YihY/UPF0761 family membrane protein
LVPDNFQLFSQRVNDGAERLRGLRPTLRYLSRTEVHVFGFSIAASVLLSLMPLLNVMKSLCHYVFKWQAAEMAITFGISQYFPKNLADMIGTGLLRPKRFSVVSMILLLFTANGIFEPLEVALNRAWGVTKDRSYLKNQILSFGLVLLCGALALASFLLTAMNNQWLEGMFGTQPPVLKLIEIIFFRALAIPILMLALFLTYWLLPNCRVPVRRIATTSCIIGFALTLLQYSVILSWKWIIAKMQNDYTPFEHSASIILFSALASMILLAGAEWSARPEEKAPPEEVPQSPELQTTVE